MTQSKLKPTTTRRGEPTTGEVGEERRGGWRGRRAPRQSAPRAHQSCSMVACLPTGTCRLWTPTQTTHDAPREDRRRGGEKEEERRGRRGETRDESACDLGQHRSQQRGERPGGPVHPAQATQKLCRRRDTRGASKGEGGGSSSRGRRAGVAGEVGRRWRRRTMWGCRHRICERAQCKDPPFPRTRPTKPDDHPPPPPSPRGSQVGGGARFESKRPRSFGGKGRTRSLVEWLRFLYPGGGVVGLMIGPGTRRGDDVAV